MEKDCPYCREKLCSGYIYGYYTHLKWSPDPQNLILGIFTKESEKIGTFVQRPQVKGYKCNNCNVIIVALDEK